MSVKARVVDREPSPLRGRIVRWPDGPFRMIVYRFTVQFAITMFSPGGPGELMS